MTLTEKQFVVIGLGNTGQSCARFLWAEGVDFIMMDTREEPPGIADFRKEFPDVEIICGGLDKDRLLQAREIIVSPGVAISHPELQAALNDGVSLIGDIELFVRHASKPIIAITGSNAKSTVTTLVGEMAKASGLRVGVGGNLGTPVLKLLDDANTDCYVLELSSFQLETTHSLKAQVAVVLNICEDHMDRYDSLKEYVAAKHRIYHAAENAVFNRADILTRPASDSPERKLWSFGLDQNGKQAVGINDVAGKKFLCINHNENLMQVAEIKLAGKHNLENVAAALTIACAAGWNIEACVAAIRAFKGLPHRCEWVTEKHGVRFYNDSKGTNIGATVAAISGLAGSDKNVILLAGGDGKGADFSKLAPCVKSHVKHLVLIGKDAIRIAEACSGTVSSFAESLQQAVQQAFANAEAGDIVLLSPACASFDMFTGYEARGKQFCQAVELLV